MPGKRDVEIMQIEPVGNYAVRLVFDDMHQTGLFTWVYLHELGETGGEKWQVYLDELASKARSSQRIRPSSGRQDRHPNEKAGVTPAFLNA